MDMRMASRMAVPPRESMRVRASSISLMSLVKALPCGLSRKASSLKLTMKTSSSGLESLTSVSAAASTLARLSRMLPLLSMISPMETGTSSRRKTLIACAAPFSVTVKASCARVVTRRPFLSTTVVWQTTSRVSARKTAGPVCCAHNAAAIATSATPAMRNRLGTPRKNAPASGRWQAKACPTLAGARVASVGHALACPSWSCPALLCGRIVALFPKWPQERHAVRLHQPDLDPAVLAVAGQVLGGVAEDVLVAQLDSDLGRHVGQFIEIIHLILPSPGLLGDIRWII